MTEHAADAVMDFEAGPIERVIADYMRRLDRGEAVAPDEVIGAHPELAEELRAYFDDLDEVERFAGSTLGWGGPAGASTDPPAAEAAAPAQLADYALIREIGRGGMGVVYLARQAGLNRLVCVKVLLSGRWAGEAEVTRFLREAEAAASLRHPNIVGIHELGQADGRHFFAMEYVEGRTLAELVRDGPLPAERAAGYIRDIAEAVDHAHRQGILHRDLKPSNVLIDADDRPRITDFGLARRIDAQPGGSLTTTGAIVGTPAYMPPEQATPAAGMSGPRGDVYSVGAVLYELVTGRPPFRGETPLDTLVQVRTIEPVRPGLLNPRVSVDLETICLKCLEKDPARRYETAHALADDLGRFLDRRPIRARPISRARQAWRWCRQHPVLAVLVAAVLGFAAMAATSAVVTYRAYREKADAVAGREAALEGVNGHLYVSRFQRAWQAWQAADMTSLDRLLDELRPVAGEVDRRGWEWSFLRGLGHQERRSLEGHAAPVLAAAWSPDGRRLATAGEDRIILVWDLGRGGPPAKIASHQGAVHSLAWSPDGRRLASGGEDPPVSVRDIEHDRLLHVDRERPGVVRSVAWDPDGRRLAWGGDAGVFVWGGAIGDRSQPMPGTSASATSVAWDPDGRRLAWGGDDGWVLIQRVEAGGGANTHGRAVRSRRRHAGWVNAVAWNPAGDSVASVGQDGVIKIWDAETGNERVSHATSTGTALTSLAWNPDGTRLATGGTDWTVTLWASADGRPLRVWRGHRDVVRAVAWAPDLVGEKASPASRLALASAGDDRSVKLWSTSDPDDGSIAIDQPAPVKSIAWLADGSAIAAMDLDGAIRLQSPETGEVLRSWDEPLARGRIVAADPTGRRLATVRGESAIIMGVDARGEPSVLAGHEGPVWSVAWEPAGRTLASAGNDRTIRIWDARSGRQERSIDCPDGAARLLAYRADGRRLASVSGEPVVQLWEPSSGRRVGSLKTANAIPINAITWSPRDSRLALAMADGTIAILEGDTGRSSPAMAGHRGAASSVAWSPDARRIASTGQDGTVRVWDVATLQEVLVLRGHAGPVWCVAWSPDGRRLATAGADQSLRVWGESPVEVKTSAR
jgi:WD40 repeat protein/predicted Ser/Thr protein kinase